MIYDGGLSVEEAERLADGCVAGDGELKQVELFSADVVRAKIRGLWKDY